MSVIRQTQTRKHQIEVSVEQNLCNPNGRSSYPIDRLNNNTFIFEFSLFKLIYSVAIIQVKRLNSSNRQKFTDFEYLSSFINQGKDLKIEISQIRNQRGSECLKDCSADLAVGLAVLVATELYDIKYNTLTRILGSGTRPDFKCFTKDNKELVIESKGSIARINTGTTEHAVGQKSAVPSDIKVVSLSNFSESVISKVSFIDPPSIQNDDDVIKRIKIATAEHYVDTFNLIGQVELSRYFYLMKNKLSKGEHFTEQNEKSNIYERIVKKYLKITVRGKEYFGKVEEINDFESKIYRFIGIDKELLLVPDFWDFEEYNDDIEYVEDDNGYYIFRDGVCVVDIKNILPFYSLLGGTKLRHWQESTRITDIDTMNLFNFENLLEYLFIVNKFVIERSKNQEYNHFDFLIKSSTGKYYAVQYILAYKNRNVNMNFINPEKLADFETVLITNLNVKHDILLKRKTIVIDRLFLKDILRNPKNLKKYILE